MDPLLVLISPCFRENVNVTCKTVSFLCSLDNFLLKNSIVFFLGNQISKWHPFEKKVIFTNFSHFLLTTEKTQKFLQQMSHLHTRILPKTFDYCLFLPSQFCKNWVLSCKVSLWCDSWC